MGKEGVPSKMKREEAKGMIMIMYSVVCVKTVWDSLAVKMFKCLLKANLIQRVT